MSRGEIFKAACLGTGRPAVAKSVGQDLFKKVQSARIIGLAQPEDRVFTDLSVSVHARDLNEFGGALLFRELAEREHGLLFHVGFRIVFYRVRNRASRLFASLL